MKKTSKLLLLIVFMITLGFTKKAQAQDKNAVIRIAKLYIDSAQLDNYKAALQEEIEASVRIEKGVLSLYAVADKKNPTHITVFEIYANQEAYLAHLKTPHFLKYKTTTKDMVKSLELMETNPIALKAKRKLKGIN
jgi:quinol monooxygenase YgiN